MSPPILAHLLSLKNYFSASFYASQISEISWLKSMADNKREKWDLGRFWNTLTYFEIVPFLSCLQRLFFSPSQETVASKKMEKDIILVTGATGGVGQRVVRRLLQENYQVRALVREEKRGREILGEKVELFEADLTIPETLTAKLMQ